MIAEIVKPYPVCQPRESQKSTIELTMKEGMPLMIHLGRGFERSSDMKTARPIEAATYTTADWMTRSMITTAARGSRDES